MPCIEHLGFKDLPVELKLEILYWVLYNIEDEHHWTRTTHEIVTTLSAFECFSSQLSFEGLLQFYFREELSAYPIHALGSIEFACEVDWAYYLSEPRARYTLLEQDEQRSDKVKVDNNVEIWIHTFVVMRHVIRSLTSEIDRTFCKASPKGSYSACLLWTRFLDQSTDLSVPERFDYLRTLTLSQLGMMCGLLEYVSAGFVQLAHHDTDLNADQLSISLHYKSSISIQGMTWSEFLTSEALHICACSYLLAASPPRFWAFCGFNGASQDAAWWHETQLCRTFELVSFSSVHLQAGKIVLQSCTTAPKEGNAAQKNMAYWNFCHFVRKSKLERPGALLSGIKYLCEESGVFRIDRDPQRTRTVPQS